MLTKSTFNRIKSVFTVGITDAQRPTFTKSTPAEQIAVLTELLATASMQDISPEQIKAFVLLYNAKVGGLASNIPALQKLRDELLGAPKGWHKANPPNNVFDLMNPNRSPSWVEDYQKVGDIVATLDFASAQSADDIINAIKNTFGIGGMEDALDPRAIGANDATMKLFIQAVQYQFANSRPEWIDPATGVMFKTLPQGVDARSGDEIRAELDAKIEAEKVDRRRKQQEERRAKLLAEYQKRKDAFLARFETVFNQSTEAKTFLAKLLTLSFEDMQKLLRGREAAVETTGAQSTWLDSNTVQLALDLVPKRDVDTSKMTAEQLEDFKSEIGAERLEAVALAEQFFLTRLSAAQPTWYRPISNGDLILRKAPLKEKPAGMGRSERATYNGIGRLVDKYGPAAVAKQMLAIFGIEKDVTEVFGPLPETLTVKPLEGDDKEPEELNATNVAASK